MGFRALTFAVGVYLPLAGTMPVFLGGLVRKLADRRYRREPDAEDEPEGTLFSSGLIAGASILGILAAMQAFLPGFDSDSGLWPTLAFLSGLSFGANGQGHASELWGVGVLAVLGWIMLRQAAPRAGGKP
jgi:peptidoglycan/LPS O-acetylase OafA/YrhL